MTETARLTPAQRAAAVERIGENIALSSGAGCGKTLVLARRFAELLMRSDEQDDPLGRFVALTFTDKAALEMLQRVRGTLREFAAAAAGPKRRALLEWIDALPEARISTIHSFCAAVLRTHAVEAGVDPGFAVCADDDLLSRTIFAEAVELAVLASVEQGRQGAAALIGRLGFAAAAGLVGELAEIRTACRLDEWLDPPATLRRWERELRAAPEAAISRLCVDAGFQEALRELRSARCSNEGDRLAAARDELLHVVEQVLGGAGPRDPTLRGRGDSDTWAALAAVAIRGGSDKSWGAPGSAAKIRRLMRRVRDGLADCAAFDEQLGPADQEAAEALGALAGMATAAIEQYEQLKRRRGMLDFADLLVKAGELLADGPVADAVGKQIQQLLVDEAQDTDSLQVELLERLAFGRQSPASRPGRLFIVGDPKQSIYRFRGAQVEVFEQLRGRLGRDSQIDLDLSFRSHPQGAAFINHLFAPIMGDEYVPIRAHRDQSPPQASVEFILATGDEDAPIDRAGAATQAQAAVTAGRIAEMVARGERLVWNSSDAQWRPVRYGDIAVLFSRMTVSAGYERALADRGVPYYVLAGTGFYKQQEVFDLLNALSAIDNPFDDIALVGALRSSLFGLDDNALMHIAAACSPPYFEKLDGLDLTGPRDPTLRGRLDAAQRRSLRFACELLGRLHRLKDALPIDAIVEQLLVATGYEAVLLAQFQGRRMAGNVRRLIDLARQGAGGRVALADFIAQVTAEAVHGSRYEQAAVAGEAEDVVRLMTVHKAKGLEFPVVVLPDLNAGRRGFAGRLLHRSDWGLTLNLPPNPDDDDVDNAAEPPLAFRLAKRLEDDDLRREDVRKLYVAATRAQDHLVFVGADWRTRKGDLRAGASYLAMLDERLGLLDCAAGDGKLRYGDGRYAATVRTVRPGRPSPRGGRRSRGEQLLAQAASPEDLARAILRAPRAAKSKPPALLGPLPTGTGTVELAVTALSEFEHCPMLYRWRYELRAPQPAPRAAARPAASLDAATLGTMLHRCMELLDPAAPQTAAALIRRAAAEMEIPAEHDLDELSGQFQQMLATFKGHPLCRQLAEARARLTELDFASRHSRTTLRGKIDVLYQDHAGEWHVVDYKSDRVGREGIEAHARRYELQMLAYAAAAARHIGPREGPVSDATLYFLRTGQTHVLPVDQSGLRAAEKRIAALSAELLAARRSNSFHPRRTTTCDYCPYAGYCAELAPIPGTEDATSA